MDVAAELFSKNKSLHWHKNKSLPWCRGSFYTRAGVMDNAVGPGRRAVSRDESMEKSQVTGAADFAVPTGDMKIS